jgi:hypothetical protein
MANGRCRMHGGLTPRGTDLPQFAHGRYSKSLPDRMVERYEQALADEERHDLADEIALAEMKVDDLLAGIKHGESDRLWLKLSSLEMKMRNAPEEKSAGYLTEIIRIIQQGGSEALAWQDVEQWVTRKQRVVETDMRVAQTKQEMVSIEEVMALMAGILDSIRRHVEDQATRTALARDIRALGTQGGVVPLKRDGEGSEK